MLQFEECLKCWDGKGDPQEQVQLPVGLAEPFDAAVDEEMKVELLFYICNLFSTSPLEEHFVWSGEKRIAKAILYEKVLSDRMSELFFLHDILTPIDPRDIPSLSAFLNGLLLHVLTKKTDLSRTDAAYLSDYVLLSWWNRCFHLPTSYCLLAAALDSNFLDSLAHFTPTVLSHLARYPEHSNLVTVNLLRIYSYCEERMQSCDTNAISCANQAEDPASRMLGIHANAALHQLAEHYSNCLKHADQMTPEFRIPANALHSIHGTMTTLLQRVISCGLVASLRQRPDLPLCPSSVSPLFLDRFNTARDYYVTRACRSLAVGLSNSTSSGLPSKLSCIVHAAAPKHLFTSLLSSSPSCPTHPASGDNVPASFEPHRSLICWCIEHGLGVKDYALWFVSNSDIKDVHLAQCVLSRLRPHAALLAGDDSSFCLALIQRMDRVRKVTLPEHHYLKFFKLVLKHLTVKSKSRLLQDLHSPSNSSGATPLPKSNNHWDAQTRKLFNRLVVHDSGTANTVSSGASEPHSYESCSQSVNIEFVLDCELLLLTRPVCFLTELILLPMSRRCLASQPAVHQLLEKVSYCLTVPIAAASVEMKPTETDIPITKMVPSLLESVLLRGFSSQQQLKDTCLLFHLKTMEAEADEDPICFDPIFPTSEETSKPSARSASQTEERLEGLVDPKHPLLVTMRLLVKLTRHQIVPNLLAHLYLQLQTVLQKPVQPVEAIDRFLGFLLDAILFAADGFSESISQEIVVHLLNLFELLFLSDATAYTQVNELDLLVVGVVRTLLRDTSGRDIFATASDRLCRLRETLRSHEFGPRILRFWILWFPVFDAVLDRSDSGCLEVPAYMSNLPGTTGELTLLNSVATKLGLKFSTMNLVPTEKRRCVSHMSPATLSFALLLASMSPQSAQLVTDAIISSVKSDSDNWEPDHLPNNVLLLALFLFLRSTSGDQQPNRWGRVFHVIDHLVRAGVIILSFHARHFESGDSSSPTGGFPLMDWSSLRGKLDVFALYADLFYLWLAELPQSTTVLEDTQRSWELRLLCSTMSLLTQRLATYLGPNTDICDSRFSRIVRSQAATVLQRFEQRLEIGLPKRHQSLASASEDVSRLFASVRMILHHPSPHD